MSPHRFLSDITRADLAFEAWANTPADLLCAAADALLAAMVDDPSLFREHIRRQVTVIAPDWEALVYRALEEILFLRDVEGLLLRYRGAEIAEAAGELRAEIHAVGEPVAEFRGDFRAEVKAITFHELRFGQSPDGGWRAVVVVDV